MPANWQNGERSIEAVTDEQPTSFNLAQRAWVSARAAFGSMKLLFMSAVFAFMTVAILSLYIPAWLPKSPSRIANGAILLGVLLLELFLRLLIVASLAVAVHRFILLNKRTAGIFFSWSSYIMRFALWLLGLAVVSMPVELAGLAYDQFWAGGKMLYWFAVIATWVVCIMSVLIFPAVAIEAPSSGWRERIRTSWRQMDGWFWTFVLAGILALLPVVIPFIVILIVLSFADIYILRDLDFHGPFFFILEIAKEALNLLAVVLGAAVASWVYAFARQPKAES